MPFQQIRKQWLQKVPYLPHISRHQVQVSFKAQVQPILQPNLDSVGRQRLLREVSVSPAWAPLPAISYLRPRLLLLPFLQKILCYLLQFPPGRKHYNPPGPAFLSTEGLVPRSPGPKVGAGSWEQGLSGTQETKATNIFHTNMDVLPFLGQCCSNVK